MKPIRITALLGEEQLGPYSAPPHGELLLGRAAFSGLFLDEDWAPRVLATLVPTARCWLVENGPSARMQGKSAWGPIDAPPHAIVAIADGVTLLRWTAAPEALEVTLDVGGLVEGLPTLRAESEDIQDLRRNEVGTRWVADWQAGPDLLTPQQRHTMAQLFRHLLEGTSRPKNILRPAAEALGISEDALKKRVGAVRARVNLERLQKLATVDDLGEYLIERAQLVAVEDLDPPQHARGAITRARERRQGLSPRGGVERDR